MAAVNSSMASWLPWVAYSESASARAWVLRSGSVYVYRVASSLMNRWTTTLRTASRSESTFACAAASCASSDWMSASSSPSSVSASARSAAAWFARARADSRSSAPARRDGQEAQQHGQAEQGT